MGKGESVSRKNPFVKDNGNWRNVTNSEAYFFRGKDKVRSIPIKFRIENLSL
jgi:hypothetical protein